MGVNGADGRSCTRDLLFTKQLLLLSELHRRGGRDKNRTRWAFTPDRFRGGFPP